MSAFKKLGLSKPIPGPVKTDSDPRLTLKSPSEPLPTVSEPIPTPLDPPRQAPDGDGRRKHAEKAHIVAASRIPAHGLRTKRIEGVDLPQLSAARVRAHLEPYKAPARDERGRLLPGQTGNPYGRPIGFVEYIRAMTDDGKELIDHALLGMRGTVMVRYEDPVSGEMVEKELPADPKYQSDARTFLKESGYGKALATLELKQGQDEGPDYSLLDVHETRDLLRLMAKAEKRAPPTQGSALPSGESVVDAAVTPVLPHTPLPTQGIQGDSEGVPAPTSTPEDA